MSEMTRVFTCVVCPNSCELTVTLDEAGKFVDVTGNTCRRGREYARQEIEHPRRTIASSVKVEGGELPLASVRTNRPIPMQAIFPVMEEIRKITVKAPVQIGDVVIRDVLGSGSDVVITKNVDAAE